jgi:alanine dehydrogenase
MASVRAEDRPGVRFDDVVLLVNTDRHVGERERHPERRVAGTPAQFGQLQTHLAARGIDVRVVVVAGAGEAAGFPDRAYEDAGCHIVPEAKLGTLHPAPSVVVSLKEPCPHERTIPGHPIRIGALHSAVFDETGGFAALLATRNFSGIFDGSEIGHHSYRLRGGSRVPIRASMSRLAGRFAAERVLAGLAPTGRARVVISGLGEAGTAALELLLAAPPEQVQQVSLVEENEQRFMQLLAQFIGNPRSEVVRTNRLTRELLYGAGGLILAGCRPNQCAPKVVHAADLAHLAEGATVVDLAIDEGGAIENEGAPIRQSLESLGRSLRYIADSHVPRNYPREASEIHGSSILPYLAVLLQLCARFGTPAGAVEYIEQTRLDAEAPDEFTALVQDLRAGLMVTGPSPIQVGNIKSRNAVLRFLSRRAEVLAPTWTTPDHAHPLAELAFGH